VTPRPGPRLLLVAKAPVAGLAKTRLGAVIGMDAAAELAAAALLDTIAASSAAYPGSCHVALAGDLATAVRGAEILAALAGWHVFDQEGDSFGERLAHAHRVVAELAPGPVVQIGMDTPQVTPALLRSPLAGLVGDDAVVGPAEDGGWWLLALNDGRRAQVLLDVPMSQPDTCAETVRALATRVGTVEQLRDVDTLEDAAAVADLAPGTEFARTWRRTTDRSVAS
jgi:glycosyltransferase A (GT-A) superfamily protein (DUF2064 family)